MNKRDYFKYLDSMLSNKPVDKQLVEINKLHSWNDEYKEKLTKNKIMCAYCKKYSNEKDFTVTYERRTTVETTYVDCGYGDDDRIGEVEYLWEVKTCPLCGESHEKRKQYLRTLWEKRRNE